MVLKWSRDGGERYCCDRPSCRAAVAPSDESRGDPPNGWVVARSGLLASWDPAFYDVFGWTAVDGTFRRGRCAICPTCATEFADTSQGWLEARRQAAGGRP